MFFVDQKKGAFKKILSLLIVLMVFNGCVPLKKKFIRQKKKNERKALEPILDPLDYAPVEYSNEKRYRKHFALFRVWQRDFMTEMKEGSSDKRKIYLLTASINELVEMNKYVVPEKKTILDDLIASCNALLKRLNINRGLRGDSKIIRDTRRLFSQILNDFHPKVMDGYYN